MQLDCTHIQQQLKQAIHRKQWDKASGIITEYSYFIKNIQQSTTPDQWHQYEAENRRLMQLMHLAMQQTSDDIADIDQTINRLERGKNFITKHTDKT